MLATLVSEAITLVFMRLSPARNLPFMPLSSTPGILSLSCREAQTLNQL